MACVESGSLTPLPMTSHRKWYRSKEKETAHLRSSQEVRLEAWKPFASRMFHTGRYSMLAEELENRPS